MWYLEGVNLYQILCPPKLKGFSKKHFLEFNKGDIIYFKDSPSQQVYMVSSGKVKILYYTEDGREIVKSVLTKGELFGEMALLGESNHTDFAVSTTNTTKICPLSVDKMQSLMRDNQRFSVQIFKLIGMRVRKLERRLEMLFFKDIRQRLVEFLKEMMTEENNADDQGTLKIPNYYTQKDIADLIGASRETISLLLNEFKEQGAIDYSRKEITIKSIEKLDQAVYKTV